MRPAEEYIGILQENAFRRRFGFDFKDEAYDVQSRMAQLDLMVRYLGYRGTLDDIPGRGLSYSQNLRHMSDTIYQDIMQRVPGKHRSTLEMSRIALLPTGLINGCALHDDDEGHSLDKYVILLNYGLISACMDLATALTFEILTGELTDYRRDGGKYFQRAIDQYVDPSLVTHREEIDEHIPPDVEAQIAVHIGALCSIMLQFVALHEFGHIIRGDVDLPNEGTLSHAIASGTFGSETSLPGISESQSREIAADKYAIETLCQWSVASPSAWPNFAQAFFFLNWLEAVEQRIGHRLCPYHPWAHDRSAAIHTHAISLAKTEPEEDYVTFLKERIADWRQS